MKRYTIGIYFNSEKTHVALMMKNRPAWQAGRYNFPGGHIEKGERGGECVAREFKEECGIETEEADWTYIGLIRNKRNYSVEVFTAIQEPSHGEVQTMEDQDVEWIEVEDIPMNVISNLFWLIPFALNYWKQGNTDKLFFGTFEYKNF